MSMSMSMSMSDNTLQLTVYQTKFLPRTPTCKTGQPNPFQHKSQGSLQAHAEAHTCTIVQAYNMLSILQSLVVPANVHAAQGGRH